MCGHAWLSGELLPSNQAGALRVAMARRGELGFLLHV